LVIAKLDRLSRNLAFIAALMESGVEFVAVDNPHMNKLTIHILAAVAEHEREMISERTKAALQAAKARGKVLGNPNLREAAKRGTEAASANARRFAAKVRPIIDEIVRAGATSHNAIAAKLNERKSARLAVAYGPMYRLEQSCTLSAAQAAPTHDGYKGSAVNLSIGRLCYVR
jgi:DNA invertase Pin-like site-specific DNA recombinase